MDAVGLARGRSYVIPPWSDQEAHQAKNCAANEALAIYILAKVQHEPRYTSDRSDPY